MDENPYQSPEFVGAYRSRRLYVTPRKTALRCAALGACVGGVSGFVAPLYVGSYMDLADLLIMLIITGTIYSVVWALLCAMFGAVVGAAAQGIANWLYGSRPPEVSDEMKAA